MDDEELYAECFAMFMEDPSFVQLGEALKRQDDAAAFDAAHTLKGVAGNLGLTPLFAAICAIVEPLRCGAHDGLDGLYAAVMDAKAAVEQLK